MRKFGLTIDQLRSVEMVTAGGEVVRASEDENADLFWGLRGGGGNFGVVTEFEFNLNPLGPQRDGRPGLLADGGLAEGAALLSRLDRRGAGRADDDRDPPQGAAARLRPAGAAREARGRDRLLLRGLDRGRRARAEAAEGVRLARARPVPAEALPRAPGDVRPLVPARPLVLHARLRRRRAHRRGDRHHRRARDADPLAAHGVPDLADGRRGRPRADDATAFTSRGAGHTFNLTSDDRGARGLRRGARSGRATSGRRSRRTTWAST